MTLPGEEEVTQEIAAKWPGEIAAMTGVHNAVLSMMTAGSWKLGKTRGLNRKVIYTILGLLTKACKTFRSVQILCERGLIEDANALVRVLLENCVAIAFILQKRSRERILIYHAYSSAQDVKLLNEWKKTPGLKRKATKAVLKQANDALLIWTQQLPPGTDYKRHWSGKGSFQEAVKGLRGGDAVYATLYRFTSSTTHSSDFAAHVQFDRSGDPEWQIAPRSRGFEAPALAARELLWHTASRINQRLGLGFDSVLLPHKVPRIRLTGVT